AGVVPQQGGPDDPAVLVQGDHPVLLAADGDGGDVVQPASLPDRRVERVLPGGRVDLGALRMAGAARAEDGAAAGVADDDLARLRRGVDAGDEGHGQAAPSRWRRASWLRCTWANPRGASRSLSWAISRPRSPSVSSREAALSPSPRVGTASSSMPEARMASCT